MPSYAAAGIIGGVVALGFLLWTIWTHTPTPICNEPHGQAFNPEPGYDRPRDTWIDDDDMPGGSRGQNRVKRKPRAKPECAICKESLTCQEVKNLPCEHMFHTACITQWFQHQRTCPTCRRPA